jgi:uncharacterized protein YwlG (UPF0340 family)
MANVVVTILANFRRKIGVFLAMQCYGHYVRLFSPILGGNLALYRNPML